MSLGKQLGRPPREIAQTIVSRLQIDDLGAPPEIAGPGFINLRLSNDWLSQQLVEAVRDPRLNVAPVAKPRTFVIDYSSPNLAKPMHVGHIRSTVIGDALYRTLTFLGHRVISDNHLGDWGTQFGMIIYGYKNFLDRSAYERQPVAELGRLYKLVNRLVEYHEHKALLPQQMQRLEQMQAQLAQLEKAPAADKQHEKKRASDVRRLREKIAEIVDDVHRMGNKITSIELDPNLQRLASEHANVGQRVLNETAKLHAGDPENRQLWAEFVPSCRQDIQRIYERLGIRFDYSLGESFFHDRCEAIVREFQERGLAVESDGATCVFLDGFDTPMIIRKSDGAFLYATTDLATIQFRAEQWHRDSILYVVDIRQSEHFGKLFAAARKWKYDQIVFQHVSFGTVLGPDGKPYKTREGEAVSLESLLDEGVARAYQVVCTADDAKETGPELNEQDRRRIAWVVGHGAVKYGDLSHNRTSDYEFSFDKMLDLEGNTSAYLQYAYARVQNIFMKGNVDRDALLARAKSVPLDQPEERQLALAIIRFHECLADTVVDYRPNLLTNYLYELSGAFSRFYSSSNCKVLRAETPELRDGRLLLCELTGRTIRIGLSLLGIEVLEKM
jgi:arginyl-tRNA synthetase